MRNFAASLMQLSEKSPEIAILAAAQIFLFNPVNFVKFSSESP